MNVKELIIYLQTLPEDADCFTTEWCDVYDGTVYEPVSYSNMEFYAGLTKMWGHYVKPSLYIGKY